MSGCSYARVRDCTVNTMQPVPLHLAYEQIVKRLDQQGRVLLSRYTPFWLIPFLKPMDKACWHGVNWHFGEPPIEGLAFEMDMRGVRKELWI